MFKRLMKDCLLFMYASSVGGSIEFLTSFWITLREVNLLRKFCEASIIGDTFCLSVDVTTLPGRKPYPIRYDLLFVLIEIITWLYFSALLLR